MPDFQSRIDSIYEEIKNSPNNGTVASYIPELATVSNSKFGIHLIDINQNTYSAGDSNEEFSVQSVSKVLTLSMALGQIGEKIWKRVDVEPSGNPFNSLLQLEADFAASSDVNFSWSPAEGLSCDDCPNPEVTPTSTTTYTLTVSDDNGCIKTASVIVYLSTTRRVYAPNIFSPNGDGQNDRYTIFTGPDALSINKLQIFSRWGELVYEASDFKLNDADVFWDGNFRGKALNTGVFVWYIEASFIDGKDSQFTGNTTLIK